MNIELLEKAARALVDQVEDHEIDMKGWADVYIKLETFEGVTCPTKENFCGTTACFVGWCPFLGIEELTPGKEYFGISGGLMYGWYAGRVFEITEESEEFDFFFGINWPNSAQKILERVLLVKESGEIPERNEWEGLGWEDIDD